MWRLTSVVLVWAKPLCAVVQAFGPLCMCDGERKWLSLSVVVRAIWWVRFRQDRSDQLLKGSSGQRNGLGIRKRFLRVAPVFINGARV